MNARTLILNADYTPYDIISWQRTMSALMNVNKQKMVVVVESTDPSRLVRDGSGNEYYVPTVCALLHYHNQNKPASYTKSNIYARDRNICQYCGTVTDRNNRTVDHVVPKDIYRRNRKIYPFKLGSFENVVTACRACNIEKRNRTPTQAGMVLKRKPRQITRLQAYLAKLTLGYKHPDWDAYINGY